MRAQGGAADPEIVRVYEKIRDGVRVFGGLFALVDAWQEKSGRRKVFKRKLAVTEQTKESGARLIFGTIA